MTIDPLLILTGLNIVFSLFFIFLTLKLVGKGLRIVSYLLIFFILILIDSVFLILPYFQINQLESYNYYVVEITDFVGLIALYFGLIRRSVK
ncbi:hypothetical protein [Caldiplasma sukawensis]